MSYLSTAVTKSLAKATQETKGGRDGEREGRREGGTEGSESEDTDCHSREGGTVAMV